MSMLSGHPSHVNEGVDAVLEAHEDTYGGASEKQAPDPEVEKEAGSNEEVNDEEVNEEEQQNPGENA